MGEEGGFGALIIALVDMGRKKEVVNMRESNTKRPPVYGTGRLEGYDSVYAFGQGENNKIFGCVSRDEFLVYDPMRIKQFVVCIWKNSKMVITKFLDAFLND